MEEEIAQLIYIYIKRNQDIDIFFINEAIRIIIRYYELEEYILNIKPLIDKKVYARYNRVSKTIYINYQIVNEYLQKQTKTNPFNFKISLSYKYIIFIQLLLHEVMHAKQFKQSTEYSDAENNIFSDNKISPATNNNSSVNSNPESIILYEEINAFESIAKGIENGTIGIFKGFMQGISLHKTYTKLYEFSPAERLANIDSTKDVINIATKLNDELSMLFMLWQHYESYLSGYNIGMNRCNSDEPTKYYLDSIHSSEKWQDIVKLSSNLPPANKIRLGLKTSQDELHKIASKSHQLILTLNKKN